MQRIQRIFLKKLSSALPPSRLGKDETCIACFSFLSLLRRLTSFSSLDYARRKMIFSFFIRRDVERIKQRFCPPITGESKGV